MTYDEYQAARAAGKVERLAVEVESGKYVLLETIEIARGLSGADALRMIGDGDLTVAADGAFVVGKPDGTMAAAIPTDADNVETEWRAVSGHKVVEGEGA